MEKKGVLLSKRDLLQEISEEEEASDGNSEDDEETTQDGGHAEMQDQDQISTESEDSDSSEPEPEPLEGNSASSCGKRGLSSMSFEEIINLQNQVGTKAYNKIVSGASKSKQVSVPKNQLSKYRPQEISAKKRVPFLRKVVQFKKEVFRDPRFDDLSGEFKPEVYNQSYKFIKEIRQQETQMLKKKLSKAKSTDKRQELKYLLKRMENQELAQQKQVEQREKELQFKRQQRELVKQGHRPFHLKKSDKKKLELAEKYNDLKKRQKLENFLSKKRKRNAIKDRRRLPYQHKKI